MSKRAEEKAMEVYPVLFSERNGYPSPMPDRRRAFIKGYEQAEKDLALTLEDMERIHTFLYAIKNNKSGQFTFTRLSDEQYEEALRRFNEWKDKK